MAPVWMNGVVYYLSERDWASNVWAWNAATREERQLTFHADFDVKASPRVTGVVVYEQGGYLQSSIPRRVRPVSSRFAWRRT